MEQYEVTSLQIRDMVSYVHHRLWVIVDQERKSLVFLVDYGPPNRKRSKSYEVWQRFVSQSRRSPFINHQELARLRRSRGSSNHLGGSKSQENSPLKTQTNRFFAPLLSATDAFMPTVKRGPFYMLGGVFPAVKQRWKEHGLYGCLGFEVRLADVVGLNYLNELQTDGCLAMEATRVEKREFGDLNEAVLWYSRGGDGVNERTPDLRSAAEPSLVGAEGLGVSGSLRNGETAAPGQMGDEARSSDTDVGGETAAQRRQLIRGDETEIQCDVAVHNPVRVGLSSTALSGATSLAPELSTSSADVVEEAIVKVEDFKIQIVSRSDTPLLSTNCPATSPSYHSAQASPSLAGPSFERISASCEASCSVVVGGLAASGNPLVVDAANDKEEGFLASWHEVTGTTCLNGERPSAADIAAVPSSARSKVTEEESLTTASVVSVPGDANTYSPAAVEASVRTCSRVRAFASESQLNLEPSAIRGRGLGGEDLSVGPSCSGAVATETRRSKVVVQASSQTRERNFRRQRSRSLDAPRLRAVLHRVAEQAARAVAESPDHSDVRSLEAPRPQTRPSDSTSARTNGADTSTSSPSFTPFLLTTARVSSDSHHQSASVILESRVPIPWRHSAGRSSLARTRSLSEPDSLGVLPRAPLEPSHKPSLVAEVYTDRLVMFRFRDPRLPVELKGAITTDQRLLKMLESGLPTWAIFVQSYPALCHVYRPWMRRISGLLYFVVSAVTVLIGFYDLYKNLPFVQDFLHRLFGPLYDWVEQWQMGARLGYLGTVLFLQNFQKAFRGAQGVFRSLKYLGSVAFRPVVVPFWFAAEWFRPMGAGLWGFVWETGVLIGGLGAGFVTGVWYAAVYVVSPVVGFGRAVGLAGLQLLFPVWSTISAAILLPLTLLTGALSALAPVFSAVGAFYRAVFVGVSPVFSTLGDSLRATASLAKPARQTVVAAKAATRAGSDGVFRGLWLSLYSVWSDLFWKVFGAVRRIVFGFLAFIFEINKHRLSTYNHVAACLVEAENATWQCVIGTKEIMRKVPTRLGTALRYVPVSLRGESEGESVFLDARDHFDEKLD